MSTSLPATMKAIKINGNKAVVTSNVSLPKVRPTYLLAKVDHVALNPTDWKHITRKMAAPDSTSGCDFSGVVVEVGSGVTKDIRPGDRIAATTHGANADQAEDGCFAEYALAKGDLVVKIPDNLSFEKASTFPLGATTVGQGLFQKALKLNLPSNPTKSGEKVLIYGGSTATGSLGIQLAKLAGYRVITTCSPRNNDYVKDLGADEVFDYNDKECGKNIREATKDSLKFAWDTISLESSREICSQALSSDPNGTRYGTILPLDPPREGVETVGTFMYTIFGDPFTKGGKDFPVPPEDFEFAREYMGIIEKLLHEGKLKTHPDQVGEKGLEGVLQGLTDMKNDKVSGKKLVYRVEDTPANSEASAEF